LNRPASPAVARPSGRGLRRGIADDLTAFAVILGLKILYHAPERLVWRLAGFAGEVSYRVARGRRDHARRNLRRVVEWMAANGAGDEFHRRAATEPAVMERLLRSAFRNHAYYYVELARAPRFTQQYVRERMRIETPEDVERWLTTRRALILVGLHFGAIELPGIFAVACLGEIVAPMETVRNARVQRYLYSTRDTIGVKIVSLEEAVPLLVAALKRDEPVGLVADRDITHAGLEVEMFGGRTRVPAGPALLAAQSGAPMYVSAVRRTGPGRYVGNVREVSVPDVTSRRERSRAIVREEARLFELAICDAPEQWLSLFLEIWPDLEATSTDKKTSTPSAEGAAS
jgi:lauroyl/myristoyl acyltransferase